MARIPVMVKRQLAIEARQLDRLHALSEATRVPAAVYIREGIDRVLALAETQMDTLEALAEARAGRTVELSDPELAEWESTGVLPASVEARRPP